jgi:uncharacterized protein (DUF1810 family)
MKAPNVDRFIEAQENGNYEVALSEIRDGKKRSHWIWYIFPQIHDLGHSPISKKYSISSLLEAQLYLEDISLGKNLREITDALLTHNHESADEIFGELDAMKVRSCMTLFDIVSPYNVFKDVLDNFFAGERCEKTLQIVKEELNYYKQPSCFKQAKIRYSEKGFFDSGSFEASEIPSGSSFPTIIDFVMRGESITKMVNHYLWDHDLSAYRLSGIEGTLSYWLTTLLDFMTSETDNSHKVRNLIIGCGNFFSSKNVWEYAECLDHCIEAFRKDEECLGYLKEMISKHSLLLPTDPESIRIFHGRTRLRYTPEQITSLKHDEVFVFGSNLEGMHGGGAARAARIRFGAIMGQGTGLQGQSYAIPTMHGGVADIRPYVDEFIQFATEHYDLYFYVTRIGCGIAGFKDEEIAPLFAAAIKLENVCLPKSFEEIIRNAVPQELMTMVHGQMHTFIDLLKELNKRDPIKSADDAVHRLEKIMQANIRRGDEVAFTAMRTIWCLIARAESKGVQGVDIEKLEQDMMEFHNDSECMRVESIKDILYSYSVAKMIKYIQFTNEFMRYKSYDEIQQALMSIGFSHCSENDPDYYYSFNPYTFNQLDCIMQEEWNNISDGDILNNEKLEHVFFGRFESMTKQHGLPETINLAYESYCSENIKRPRFQKDATVWGPIYRINGSNIEKGCSDFSIEDESFEMRFAKRLLANHPAYEMIGNEHRSWLEDTYYVPKEDFTLPVYSEVLGKLEFASQEEKERKINELKDKRDEYAR